MPRTAARIIVSLWLLGGCLPGAAVAQTPGALEVTLKAGEAPGAATARTVKLYSASKALVVGIDAYSAGWPRLSMAVKDAKAAAEALKLQGFEVASAFDPTQDELERAFRNFFIRSGADPDARLLVWFAGHGHTVKNSGGGDEGYIVPRDAPSPLVSDTEFRGKAISLRRFGEYMREARAKHVLAVFDSCFGGSVFNVARALQPPPAITHATALPVRQFISSGDADQEVSDDGTFRRLFIDALQGAEPAADVNKDGYLTGTGLGQFLYTKMTNLTGQRQTPRYGKLVALGYDRGDFVFQVREPKAGAAPKASPDAPRQLLGEAAQAWADIKELRNVAVFEAFRKQYGAANPLYDTLASQRIEELKAGSAPGQGGAAASWWPWGAPGPQPQPAKPPETQTAVSVTVGTSAPVGVAVPIGTAVPVGVSVPTSKPEPACDGLLVSVAIGGSPCIKPGSGESFRDCPDCPEMVLVPAGSFTMGSPPDEKGRSDSEGPQHKVTISKPFAVGKFVATFDEWDACVSGGGCKGNPSPGDEGWGKGRRPVINVSWEDAREYVKWLSRKTDKKYRLLSEAEWEYAARAGTRTRYFWGDSLGRNNANCGGCGSEWDGKMTAQVGQFRPNAFGLYDMAGNVWQRTDDCWNGNYNGAPEDGSAIATGDCSLRVLRGGSWSLTSMFLGAAARDRYGWLGWGDSRVGVIGFRVARTF